MNALLNKLSSLKITVSCLLLLFTLTFWGTVAQVEHGLYAAQERYFYSFFFLIHGFFPFPGGQLVLWVLALNLASAAINHFSRLHGPAFIGRKIIHVGILIYFASAFVTFHVMTESNVDLAEGQGTNVSASYDTWEIAFWKDKGENRQVTAYDMNRVKPGDIIQMDNIQLHVEQFYLNCEAILKGAGETHFINADAIEALEPQDMVKERDKNIAGVVLTVGKSQVLLYGAETLPTKVGDTYFILRHKRYPLPFTIYLKQFKVEFHPGTAVAKSYESIVEIIKPGAKQEARIYMNNPLRYRDYTFYQSSYFIDPQGRKYSTLAVVKNAGHFLPYAACFVVLFGLVVHFLSAALRRKRQ